MGENKALLPINCMNDLTIAGSLIAQSGILGASTPAEGFLVCATCQQTGMSYLEFGEKYHVFHGKISKKAEAILADFNRGGGKHDVVCRTPDKAAIRLTPVDGKPIDFELTWEELKEEPFIYRGGPMAQMVELAKPFEQRKLKQKYTTRRGRMQMMWARLISDSVRAVDPCSTQGMYPQEIIEDFTYQDEPAPRTVIPEPIQAEAIKDRVQKMKSAVPEITPPAPQPIQKPEPSPFPVQTPEQPEIDYSTCPIPGQMMNIKWSDMSIDNIGIAMKITHPAMMSGHYDCIRMVMKEREGR